MGGDGLGDADEFVVVFEGLDEVGEGGVGHRVKVGVI